MSVEAFQKLYDDGLALVEKGDKRAGELKLLEAAKASPVSWFGLGSELIQEGQREAGVARLREVLRLTQNAKLRAACLVNIGKACAESGRNQEAMECFHEAMKLWPEKPDAMVNIGLMHKFEGRYEEAIRWCNRALKVDPWHEAAQFIRAMALLLSGDYARGFEEYECRWRSKSNKLQKLFAPCPEWNGRNGSKLYVYGEQGHGDSILMLRYAKLIKERGFWQAWTCQKAMTSLVATVTDIDQACPVGESLPDFDTHVPSVSLPRIFGTTTETIPPAPYIPAPPDCVEYGPGFHVGIAWRGSVAQANDLFRSTRLDEWRDVLAVPGVTFHSLQVDNNEESLVYPKIVQYETKPADWLDTARRVAKLDLVICVDTGLAHLCGALGVNAWVAMHCRPYFVYPPKFGEKTPWYGSLLLFRQKRELEWQPVFHRIAEKLKCLTS